MIERDAFLYVSWSVDQTELSVYRSVLVDDECDLYAPVRDLIEGLTLKHRKLTRDRSMMFATAELLVYRRLTEEQERALYN